jgi:hypothetical protein
MVRSEITGRSGGQECSQWGSSGLGRGRWEVRWLGVRSVGCRAVMSEVSGGSSGQELGRWGARRPGARSVGGQAARNNFGLVMWSRGGSGGILGGMNDYE